MRMTQESIDAFLEIQKENGASTDVLRQRRGFVTYLFRWLPEDKTLTKERLLHWRESMQQKGYTQQTVLNYVKGINLYLDYMGWSDLRFNRGRAKDIAGKQFGYLTAIEPTGEKDRRNLVWRCRCQCGNEVAYSATRLLTGNTLSCGCLRGENIRAVNKYCDGTSIRQALEEQVFSTKAASGYTGVTMKRDKWMAYIKYKGRRISLGCYEKLPDAVKARARGKELVRLDAMGLLDFYEELHKDDPARPNRAQVRQQNRETRPAMPADSGTRAIRSNNTSGYPGVTRKRDRWAAMITHQKVTYRLGSFLNIEEAITARKEAEKQLREDPLAFAAAHPSKGVSV